MSSTTPGAVHLHFPADLKTLQSIARAFQAYSIQTRIYAVRDSDNNVLGLSLFVFNDTAFPNYIKSYWHGELCGNK
jgi:hypothetical protein